jgi:DNA-binding NarL/FixJ family response regulator
LKDLARDASNQEIAEHLAISVPTVKKYIHYIFQKLNLKNRKEAGSFAHQQGFEKS